MSRWLAGAVIAAVLSGCGNLGGIDDGTSVSRGSINSGRLVKAMRLPVRGEGYVVPPTWASRGLSWGTEELVALIVRSARRVARETPGAQLYVADLSPRRGGPSAWHRSHQTGRDADLLFYALDEAGRSAAAPMAMIPFGADGATAPTDLFGNPIPRFYFDVPRNWALVRALIEDPDVDVQYLFIYEPLKQMLVDHAIASGEPLELVQRAQAILHQPGDALPHDDHLHLRIYCPATDRTLGCRDRGPLRWFKKGYKYMEARGVLDRTTETALTSRPFCRLLAARLYARL